MSQTPPPPGDEPPGYGAPPPPGYGAPPPGYGAPKNDTKAVLALVLGITSVLLGWCCFIFGAAGVAAIVLGRMARREIAANPATLTGAGMARAGFILGIVGTALTVIFLVLNILFFTTGMGNFDFYVDPRQ
ncbi:MAG TPA: DUF4190 domain-containing protein [Nocardioidaceae bacterium]|nr:DUF4190 domain-containing protein [Nocardioidaceae bacterium]